MSSRDSVSQLKAPGVLQGKAQVVALPGRTAHEVIEEIVGVGQAVSFHPTADGRLRRMDEKAGPIDYQVVKQVYHSKGRRMLTRDAKKGLLRWVGGGAITAKEARAQRCTP